MRARRQRVKRSEFLYSEVNAAGEVLKLPRKRVDKRVDGGEAAVLVGERGKLGGEQSAACDGINRCRTCNVKVTGVEITSLAGKQVSAAHLYGTAKIFAHGKIIKIPLESGRAFVRVPGPTTGCEQQGVRNAL